MPFDDVLTLRWRTCQCCAGPADRVELWSGADAEAVALGLCFRCLRQDSTDQCRAALLARQVEQRARGG
jgi:hypothetical protein